MATAIAAATTETTAMTAAVTMGAVMMAAAMTSMVTVTVAVVEMVTAMAVMVTATAHNSGDSNGGGHRQQSTERGATAEEMTMTATGTARETAMVPCYGGGGGNVVEYCAIFAR